SPIKDAIYSHYKSEVNRIMHAFMVFDEINNDSELTLEQEKDRLIKNYHYYEKKIVNEKGKEETILVLGSAMRMYYFGKDNYDITEKNSLYETIEIDGEIIPTGLKEGLIDTDGFLVDFGIKKIFDEILDPFLTEMIESKLKQIAPIQ